MYQRILLCYDATEEGRNALRQGADIAIAMQAQTHLLAICRTSLASAIPEGVNPALFECDDARAAAILEEGVAWLRERGLEARGTLVYGEALDAIPQAAAQLRADLVVVGHRSRGRLARWWSGSAEETLLDRTHCSILAAVPPAA